MKTTDLHREAARLLVSGLREDALTLAVAESLTGGLLSAAIVAISGASDVYRGGVTTYAPATKISVLGLPEALIREGGTVQAEVATRMALSVRELFGADIALSTTGVAGPGPSEGHPAGTVFIGYADGAGARSWPLQFPGDRDAVREQTVQRALELVLDRRIVGRSRKEH